MLKEVRIQDALYGTLVVKGWAAQVIKQDVFLRLKGIGQFGALGLWHPNGSYSRYDHCIGTWYLTQCLLRKMQAKYPELLLSGRVLQLAGLAALLHDIGHGPMSHLFDEWTQQECPEEPLAHHEARSVVIMEQLCREVLHITHQEEVDFIRAMILGNATFLQKTENKKENRFLQQYPWLLYLLNKGNHGALDVDNLDYINRDCLQLQGQPLVTWAEMSVFLDGLRVLDGKLCFDQDGLPLIKKFLQCRYDFHSQYYSSLRTVQEERKIDFTALKPLRHLLQSGRWLDCQDSNLIVLLSSTKDKNLHKSKPVQYLPTGVEGVWLHYLGNARFQILARPI